MPRHPLENITNSASLSNEYQKAIADYILHHSNLISFREYQNKNSHLFGKHGDRIREKTRKRLYYLTRLQKNSPAQFLQYVQKVSNQTPCTPQPPISESRTSDPQPPISESRTSDPQPTTSESRTSDPRPPIFKSKASPEPSTMSSHLHCQQRTAHKIDVEHPEKNCGIYIFKVDSVAYGGKKINVRQFVMPLNDPRDYPHVEVSWDGLDSIAVKKPIIPENLVGDKNGRNAILQKMHEKVIRKTMEFDKVSEDEATAFSCRAIENLICLSNDQEENPPSRFESRVYSLPNSEEFRQDLFGNSAHGIQTMLSLGCINHGKFSFYAPCVTWFIALNGKVGVLDKVKKQSKKDELDEEFADGYGMEGQYD
jgi:hypothetical protein